MELNIYILCTALIVSVQEVDAKSNDASKTDEDFQSIKFKDCGAKNIEAVIIPDCKPSASVCHMRKGHNYKLQVIFTTTKKHTELSAEAEGKVMVFGSERKAPLPLPKPNACNNSGLKCPLKKGKQYTYETHIPIPQHLPSVEVTVAWKLVDAKKNEAFCFEAKYKIV